MSYGDFGSSLRDLPRLRSSRRRRASSWDITGGNDDRLTVSPGATDVLADIDGPGSINHIWCTVAVAGSDADRESDPEADEVLRRLLLRITWDDERAAERAGAAGRLLRRRARPDGQLRVRAAADEPAGRPGVQQLVPHAVRLARDGGAGERDEPAAGALLLLRRLRDARPRTTTASATSTPGGTARTRPTAGRRARRRTWSTWPRARTSPARATTSSSTRAAAATTSAACCPCATSARPTSGTGTARATT